MPPANDESATDQADTGVAVAGGSAGSEPRNVVACVLLDTRDRMLVGRRPMNKRHGGLWEFPGGKVRAGESLAEAAARELKEELGLAAIQVAEGVLFEQMDPGSAFRILFVRVATQEAPRSLEHEALEWLNVVEVRDGLELAPADAAFVRAVREGAVTL